MFVVYKFTLSKQLCETYINRFATHLKYSEKLRELRNSKKS